MSGTPINDDQRLEAEADRMGALAANGPATVRGAAPMLRSRAAASAPAQCARSWWKKKNALLKTGMLGGAALAGVGALLASPLVMGIGGVAAIGSGVAYALRQRKPSAPVADSQWFDERHETAYGYTNPRGKTNLQGPHFVPHIAKKVVADRSIQHNPNFDPTAIYEGSGVLPTAGQARKLLRYHEQASGNAIPLEQKKALDRQYKEQLRRRRYEASREERVAATARAMELNPLATYAHGRVATHNEIKGKGENRRTVTPDVVKMESMVKGQPAPTFAKIDYGPGHFMQRHLDKFLRDTGKVSSGDPDLSDLDTDSDEEY